MKIYKEVSASDFDFWSGARDTVKYLTEDEINTVFDILESCGGEYSDTDINDLFWFEDDTVAEWLGWDDFETIMNARSGGNWFDTQAEYEDAQEDEEEDEDEEDEEDE